MKGSLMSRGVAEPYAQALMSLAQSRGLTAEIGDEMRALSQLLEESAELRDFISNPVIEAADKKAVLRRIAGERASEMLVNFLMLLVDKRRLLFLSAIAEQYLVLLRARNEIVLAEVASAQALSEDQAREIASRVRSMTDARDVELKTSVDASLLGGAVIKIGSQVLDLSLRGQLRRIGISLAG
ncbi:MAG: F0F1 ATP synthase subunit delta [Spirulinaceae cyanobacterium RM2_2_10]|nr:F0F1 ATP synthase subunit delta [Spirulinaceae cyanobacterium SM2_1_0]NJO20901.1 F0F1 ATP synthase subunit delta [Spirulinaceae cyanobacterium RM2_2_10]